MENERARGERDGEGRVSRRKTARSQAHIAVIIIIFFLADFFLDPFLER